MRVKRQRYGIISDERLLIHWFILQNPRTFPIYFADVPIISRDFPRFSRDFPIISRVFPRFSRDFPIISRDFPRFSRDFPIISRVFPRFSRDFPIISRDFPRFSRDFPIISRDFPRFSMDFPRFSMDFGIFPAAPSDHLGALRPGGRSFRPWTWPVPRAWTRSATRRFAGEALQPGSLAIME